MNSTSESLLLKLKNCQDGEPWNRFVELYTPLIFFWARKNGLPTEDASDLVQDVLAIVFQKIPFWEYDRQKSFRGWLRTVTLNRHRELIRKKKIVIDGRDSVVQSLALAEAAQSSWDLGYARQLVAASMKSMKGRFAPGTWSALRELMAGDRPAVEVAEEKGISVWTLYAARSRLLNYLRKELEGLL